MFFRLASAIILCHSFCAGASGQGLDQQWQDENNRKIERSNELDKICQYFASGKAVGSFEQERFYLNTWNGKPSLLYCVHSWTNAGKRYWPRYEFIIELNKTYTPCPFKPEIKACMFKLEDGNVIEYWQVGDGIQRTNYGSLQ